MDLTASAKAKIRRENCVNIEKARRKALYVQGIRRTKYLDFVRKRNLHLLDAVKNKDAAKIALAMLYLGEGTKNSGRAKITFGNSDPLAIKLFLKFLRFCYYIDEKKFRCTIQCRADQNVRELECFWSDVTGIPLKRFYGARIDSRSIGKRTLKSGYKGVCRIDYLSAEMFIELTKIIEIMGVGL